MTNLELRSLSIMKGMGGKWLAEAGHYEARCKARHRSNTEQYEASLKAQRESESVVLDARRQSLLRARTERACGECGQTMFLGKNQLSRKFCSRKCSAKAQSSLMKSANACLHCGGEIIRPEWMLKRGAHFCSRDCYHEHRKCVGRKSA